MNNAEYWKKRFAQLEDEQYKKCEEYEKNIERQFKIAQNNIKADIERWYYRLAENNDITYSAAKKLLSKNELEEFHWTVEEYIKYGKENAINQKWIKQLENASARVHIKRLEAMNLQIQQEAEKLFQEYHGGIAEFLVKSYADRYYHTAYEIAKGSSIGHNFAKLDTRKIETVLTKPWAQDGANFSDRIWKNKEKLINTLNTELTQCIIRGENPYKAVEVIGKKLDVSRKQASTLVYTESAAITAVAQKECFEELDVERYVVVATLDNITSEICRSMDGKVFEMKDYKAGLTAPPFHCNCRSVTCPYFNDEFTEGEKRAARGEDGKTYYVPADMNYEEWKKEYVDKVAEESEKADYLFRSHIPGENITKEKLTVIDTISNLPPKVQSVLNDGTIIDIGKDGASQYDYNHDILYIAKGANKEAVIHEIGHMVENKMMNADVIEKLKRKCINQVDMKDIKTEFFYDGIGTEHQVLYIQSNRLISEYQGRIYVDNMLDAIDEDGNIKYNLLWEFVSEAFKEYIMNPKLLKEKNSELYNYIEEIVS